MKNLSTSSSTLREMMLSGRLGRVLWALLISIVIAIFLPVLLSSATSRFPFSEQGLLDKTTYLLEHVAAQSTTATSQTVRLTSVAQWLSANNDLTASVAWGDVDGDGDLDLAVGNRGQPNKLYLNTGNMLQTTAAWVAQDIDATMSVAWGDVDGDGDLDLAVGNWGQPNKLYLNSGGVLRKMPVWSSNDNDNTTSVAWGDVNGDGYLDLAVGNWGQPNKLYLNMDMGSGKRMLSLKGTSISTVADDADKTSSIAWGDMNRDGYLDLAVANYLGNSKVYCNDRQGGFKAAACWDQKVGAYTYSVAWGDMDDDGDLDLAFGNATNKNTMNDKQPNYQARDDMNTYCGQESNVVYANMNGKLGSQPAWSSSDKDCTVSVAWGDVDSDGRLDLVAGNWFGSIKVYLNQGTKLQTQAAWLSSGRNKTFDVAWGDMDGDGDLDLAVANYTQANQVYRNDGSGMETIAKWTSSGTSNHSEGIAWGDMDGDGDLDLAASDEYGSPNWVYRNQNGILDPVGIKASPIQNYSLAVAWGDMDGDGHLDLAVANSGYDKKTPAQPDPKTKGRANKVYLYKEGKLQNIESWSSQEIANTASVAWGDVDDDGDLDLAVGNYGEPNSLYLNENGMLRSSASWSSLEKDYTTSVAWGDIDGDGDLDLAAGNMTQTVKVYINAGGMLEASAAWSAPTGDKTTNIAWGDMDGDGDLDLAVANTGQPNKVYINIGGTLQTQGFWSSSDNDFSSSVSWGDIDGDGDLDLAVGNNGANKIYWNEHGTLQRVAGWSTAIDDPENYTVSSALGDMNGDGYLDFAGGKVLSRNELYLNRRPVAPVRASQAPTIRLSLNSNAVPLFSGKTGTSLAPANFYAVPGIRQDGSIPITYTLFHPTGEPVRRIQAFYSPDGGGRWYPAIAANKVVTTNLATSPYPTISITNTHVYTWDVSRSNFFGQSDNVVLRLVAYAQGETITGTYRYTNTVAGPFQWPYASATTLPFRVRGTQVRVVDETGQPVAGAIVYRLKDDQFTGATPVADPTGQSFRTNQQGYLSGRGALYLDDGLVALLPMTPTQAITFTNQYSFYLTSAAPAPAGLELTKISSPGIITLTIPLAAERRHPLLLFHLTASLEWDAGEDELFRAGLTEGFRRASELLFKLTNGQAAIGRVDLFPAKLYWGQTDLILYASNSLRPSAAIGGVVKIPISETVFSAITPKATKQIVSAAYVPGQVRMGTSWDPFGEEAGDLSEQWWRALVHELSHHLFFLPDNYLGFKTDGSSNQSFLGRVDCQPSFMTTTFDTSYTKFLDRPFWLGDCLRTVAAFSTGRSDWETITHFYPMLKAPTESPTAGAKLLPSGPPDGPNLLPLDVTHLVFWSLSKSQPVLPARYFQVRAGTGEVVRLPTARVYLFQTQGTDDPTDDVLIALGSPTGGGDRIKVRGGQPGDRLCLFDFGASDGKTYTGCIRRLSAADISIPVRALAPERTGARWSPAIDIRALTTRTLAVTVTQVLSPNMPLKVQVFPAHYASAPGLAPIAALTLTNGVYLGQVQLSYPASDVSVRVWVDDGTNLEAVSQFNLQLPWQPNDLMVAGPGSPIVGGPGSPIVGGPGSPIVGGPGSPIVGGPGSPIVGGPGSPIVGGPNQSMMGGAPMRSADAQVVIYNQAGLFEPSGIEGLQILPSPPELNDEPWLVPIGQAYLVQPDTKLKTLRRIAVTYLQRDVPEGYEYTLTLYYLPKGGKTWQRLPTTQFVENLIVANLQPGTGTYAVMSTVALPALHPGWNVLTYPLPDKRPVVTALASLANVYSVIYKPEPDQLIQLGQTTDSAAKLSQLKTNVKELEFGQVYWIKIEGKKTVTPFLAPLRRAPNGIVGSMR